MKRTILSFLVTGPVLGLVFGCQQADPPGADTAQDGSADAGTADGGPGGGTVDGGPGGTADDGSGGATGSADDNGTATGTSNDGADTATGGPFDLEGYYPLVDGGTWTFRRTAATGEVLDEIETMVASVLDGAPAFELQDNEDANGSTNISFLQENGTSIARVHKNVYDLGVLSSTVDYDPGFKRFDTAWVQGVPDEAGYTRSEFDAAGLPKSEEMRLITYTLEETSVEVTVPAGTFDCVQVLRVRADTGETKRFWFAKGVGKVKLESVDSGSMEELVEYTLP